MTAAIHTDFGVRVYSVFNPWLLLPLFGILLSGCSQLPGETADTGAKECVETFYQALIQQDWTGAYAALAPRSQKACPLDQFSRQAQNYRNGLGFEPEAIHIQACQEHGSEAIAHVVLTGRNADQERRYKDAVSLHRGADGWRIVLLTTFGRSKLRSRARSAAE